VPIRRRRTVYIFSYTLRIMNSTAFQPVILFFK
jgi:hypothetical protein